MMAPRTPDRPGTPRKPGTPNKHELRTAETRERLLKAAEQVFLRDGYERAELGEIAKLAGRTKGAIYAQFESKEAIFLALVEMHALRRRGKVQKHLNASASTRENLATFRKDFLASVNDETWGLLLLEFKLYSLRHPDAQDRLKRVYETIIPSNEEAVYASLLGSPGRGKAALGRAPAVHAGFAMLTGLTVEARFGGKLDAQTMEKIAARLFEALFDR
ncbi:MAG: TetR/AcrR family transcriptional regulator [Edaphobacter sp.]|uniref:TetR/AcrR family transcriptional regulator n=1 Tax=Edaphobacter sp. TaxID=1934404 RepID=UPI00239CED61|nr:TetR/AcrR family transcriptional regulator [Edaphobacter sp.]MDE1176667.1 TetR/AcrR family transcriptional regulator [Edaphobacter sp.]